MLKNSVRNRRATNISKTNHQNFHCDSMGRKEEVCDANRISKWKMGTCGGRSLQRIPVSPIFSNFLPLYENINEATSIISFEGILFKIEEINFEVLFENLIWNFENSTCDWPFFQQISEFSSILLFFFIDDYFVLSIFCWTGSNTKPYSGHLGTNGTQRLDRNNLSNKSE